MKKLSVVLTSGLPLSFDAELHEVNEFRELLRDGKGVFSKLDFNIPIAHVTLMTVADIDDAKTEEDGCNS